MNPTLKKDIYSIAFLAVLAAWLFGFRLGSFGLLDPDEPFYALTAKEMLQTREFFTPILFGHPQFEKPIFFYWVEVLNFGVFGINEFAARLGPCIAGILTVIVTYLWGRVLFKRRGPALLSAVFLASAVEFIVVSRIVLTDVFLCLFVTLALASFSLGAAYPNRRKIAWNLLFFFCGLGFLTKGPLGILLPFFGITPYLLLSGQKKLLKEIPWRSGLIIFSIIAFPWYALMTARHGVDFLKHFFLHENVRRFFYAEHRNWDNFFAYPIALILGFFPWSTLVPGSAVYALREGMKNRSGHQKIFLFLSLTLVIPLGFFIIAKSKLLSYILPIFPSLALIMGAWSWRLYRSILLKGVLRRSLVCWSFLFSAIFPVAIVAGAMIYSQSRQLDLLPGLIFLLATFVPLYWFSFFCFVKKRFKIAFISLLAGTMIFSSVVFGYILPGADSHFSCRQQVQAYQKRVPSRQEEFFLAGKILARGISYYTGSSHIGVLIDNPKKAFYTKHPIPIVSSREDLLKIDRKWFPVYCFLGPKQNRFLQTLLQPPFSATVLDASTPCILVRLDRADEMR